jgi:hypothetical protein
VYLRDWRASKSHHVQERRGAAMLGLLTGSRPRGLKGHGGLGCGNGEPQQVAAANCTNIVVVHYHCSAACFKCSLRMCARRRGTHKTLSGPRRRCATAWCSTPCEGSCIWGTPRLPWRAFSSPRQLPSWLPTGLGTLTTTLAWALGSCASRRSAVASLQSVRRGRGGGGMSMRAYEPESVLVTAVCQAPLCCRSSNAPSMAHV